MKDKVIEAKYFLKKLLANFLPRWVILFIDLFIVGVAFITLWYFRSTLSNLDFDHFSVKLLMVILIYSITSIIFKTYRGIVRYSTWTDFKKIGLSAIVATLMYSLVMLVINYSNNIFGISFSFSYMFPLMLGLMVLGGQLAMRVVVKSIFDNLEQQRTFQRKRIFILGSDYESVLLAKSLIDDINNPYEPVALLSTNHSLTGKNIGNLPIISLKKGLRYQMDVYRVNTMLLFKSQIEKMPREFYDNCILEGLELLVVSMFTRFENGNGEEHATSQIDKIRIEDLLGRNTIVMDRDNLAPYFNNKTILVTGAAGSIGSEIATQLTYFNCKQIILLDQAETPLNDLYLTLIAKNTNIIITPVIGSVSSMRKMRQVFECAHPEVIFHAAAYKHVPMMEAHPSASVITNVQGTKVVADLAVEFGVERFVMISTDKAVNPTSVMGATKRAAEIYIQSLHHKLQEEGLSNPIQFITTRFGNVLGSSGSVVPIFKKQIENGGPVTVTHRDITRYFMTIPEACSLVLEAGCMGHGGEIYIFDMGEAVKIYDLAEKMIRLSGKTPGKDIKIVETGLRPGEKLYEELLICGENTLPTYHCKLWIAKVKRYKYSYTASKIDELNSIARQWIYPLEVVKKLKALIPEYTSQNSPKYEEIDKENHLRDEQIQYIEK